MVGALAIASITFLTRSRFISNVRDVAEAVAVGKTGSEAAASGQPSLFCWSHMMPGGYEVPLIQMQFMRRASIFACDEFAVISTDKIKIGDIWGSGVYTWVNKAPEVPMGENGVSGQTTDSFLNTEIFLLAWDSLIGSDHLWSHDFVVKADPDAVFLPDRLRKRVAKHMGNLVYFPNCGKWGHPLLYGALEVLSVPATRAYQKHMKECKALPWQGWGEDYYIQHCMDLIGVKAVPDIDQVADERCLGAPCSDWTKVAFHDFKDPDDWYKCFQIAIGEFDEKADSPEDRQMLFKKKL